MFTWTVIHDPIIAIHYLRPLHRPIPGGSISDRTLRRRLGALLGRPIQRGNEQRLQLRRQEGGEGGAQQPILDVALRSKVFCWNK